MPTNTILLSNAVTSVDAVNIENTDTPIPQNVSEDLEEDVIDEEFCNDGDD